MTGSPQYRLPLLELSLLQKDTGKMLCFLRVANKSLPRLPVPNRTTGIPVKALSLWLSNSQFKNCILFGAALRRVVICIRTSFIKYPPNGLWLSKTMGLMFHHLESLLPNAYFGRSSDHSEPSWQDSHRCHSGANSHETSFCKKELRLFQLAKEDW